MRGDTYHSEILEGTGRLNVLQRSSKVLQLKVDSLLGSLGILDSLCLKSIDGLELAVDVVGGGLELVESLLDLVHDGLVLKDRAVGGEIDGRGLLGELLNLATRVLVALLEGLEGRDGLAAETQRAGHLGPVELESSASLWQGRRKLAHQVDRIGRWQLKPENRETASSSLFESRIKSVYVP